MNESVSCAELSVDQFNYQQTDQIHCSEWKLNSRAGDFECFHPLNTNRVIQSFRSFINSCGSFLIYKQIEGSFWFPFIFKHANIRRTHNNTTQKADFMCAQLKQLEL